LGGLCGKGDGSVVGESGKAAFQIILEKSCPRKTLAKATNLPLWTDKGIDVERPRATYEQICFLVLAE
jgi:hypothetical protein